MIPTKVPPLDQWVAILNVIAAGVSVIVNWQASRAGLFRFRVLHAAIMAVSVMYVAGYLWLLGVFGDVQVARWSSVMRGFSLVAWLVVWILPAVVSIRATHELHQAIRSRQEGDQ